MNKLLIVVDMQNDFIDGSLGTPEAEAIVDNVIAKINTYTNILPFELVESGCKKATYRIRIQTPAAGVHDYAIRVYPHCNLMPHRMDFPVVKWV